MPTSSIGCGDSTHLPQHSPTDGARPRVVHGPQWGIAYSLVYRVLVTEILPAMRAEDARLWAAQRSQYRRPARSAAMAMR